MIIQEITQRECCNVKNGDIVEIYKIRSSDHPASNLWDREVILARCKHCGRWYVSIWEEHDGDTEYGQTYLPFKNKKDLMEMKSPKTEHTLPSNFIKKALEYIQKTEKKEKET